MKGKGINVVEKFLALNTDSALMELQIGERAYYSARDKYDLKNNHPGFHKFIHLSICDSNFIRFSQKSNQKKSLSWWN